MTDKVLPKINKALLIFAVSILFVACNFPSDKTAVMGDSSIRLKTQSGEYTVDPTFRDFYVYLGGVDTLGPAISPLQEADGFKQQYLESGLMVYDPRATPSDRYRLAPLALGFEVAEPPVPEPEDPGLRCIAGHIIHPDFLPLYKALGGARFVGLPLTEARHNPAKMRIEQYFENLGFYRLVDDPSGEAHLMAYGVLACDRKCRYQVPLVGIPETRPPLPEPFALTVSNLGLGFVGLTLSEPYMAPDGKWEVIFENMVLASDSGGAKYVAPRPIVEMVGFLSQPMRECQDRPLAICLPGEENKGYSVPILFHEYVLQHGGWDLFGMPTSEVYLVEDDIFRQCYTNLCLDFDLNADPKDRLKPVALGKIYKDLYYEKLSKGTFEGDFQGLRILVWEKQALIHSGQPQEIHVTISEHEVPLANREPVLTLTLPDGSNQTYNFPPTDGEGKSSVNLSPVEAPNGTLIPYEVCLAGIYGKTFCISDHYLIWNYP